MLAAAVTAATLAACAQSGVVTNQSASLTGSRQAATRADRWAQSHARRSAVAARHAAAAHKVASADANDGPASKSGDATYGLASFYSRDPHTASGERFDSHELTAAHRSLPFGTRVRVTNVATGQSVTVRVNDRGPFVPGRVVDVSHGAAEELGIVKRGVAKVKVEVVE
ncbi:MAG TPA: septal ring lytic transglycosylase RlpA family protein [Xanthobacteraceae bacterium]